MTTVNSDIELKTTAATTISDAEKTSGKVRDIYDLDDKLLIVTTDRLSAFDRAITTIPHKGQVLNLISEFWFKKTASIVNNHCLSVPLSNTMLVKKVDVLPVEFVVRGYMTGSTSTSIWTLYQQGERDFGGITLPDGLTKNAKLPKPIITPTTKSIESDEPITAEEIVAQGLMTQAMWDKASEIVLSLFNMASTFVSEQDLILVDTKFELGVDEHNEIILIDEVLTPDSSRYWRQSNYLEKLKAGQEPDNFDKEILRRWYREHSDPYKDEVLPEAPTSLRQQLSDTYISLYEKITGSVFDRNLPVLDENPVSLNNIL